MRLIPALAFIGCLLLGSSPALSQPAGSNKQPAAGNKKSEPAASDKAPAPPPLNACGCYEDKSGLCQCTRKSKCGCPGACEPKGCEDKRNKELAKEADQEIKRQREEEKKRNAELSKKRTDEEREEAKKGERNLRGLRLVEPSN